MKHKLTLALATLLCTFGVIRAQVPFTLDEEGYYLLSTAADLVKLSELSNDAFTRGDVQGAKYKLTQDIDMGSIENFTPICFTSANGNAFTGTFDGQGHTISNLTITTGETNNNHLGFIGLIFKGFLRNVCLKDVTVNNNSTLAVARGALIGRNGSSTIENCCVINFTFRDACPTNASTTRAGVVCGYMSDSETTIYRNNYSFNALRYLPDVEQAIPVPSYGGKGGKATVANYYDDNNTTPEDFASGRICYLLNGSQSDNPVWFQTLGEDASPVLDTTHKPVYLASDLTCDGKTKGEPTYGNSASGTRDPHTFVDGVCTVCGNAEPDWLQPVNGIYQLGTPEQLLWFAAFVNGGNSAANAVLVADIDLAGVDNFTPIGLFGDNSPIKARYSGTFDGQGHIVSNLNYTTEEMYEAGLFSRLNSATVKNLGVVNASLTSNHHAASIGVLAGYAVESTFTNCFSAGSIVLVYTNEEIGVPVPQLGGISGNTNNTSKYVNCWSTYKGYISTGGGTFTNCYDGDAVEGRLETGELTWMLNGQQFQNPTWFQTLGVDSYPVLDSTHRIVYKAGDEYSDVGNDETFPPFRSYIISQESEACDQTIATQQLLDDYLAVVNGWEEIATLDAFLAAYGEAKTMRDAISRSVNEYKAYEKACQEVREQLATLDIQNSHRDFLEDYLDAGSEIEPGDYPNGNSTFILADHTLTGEELAAEKEYLEKLLLRVVLSNPAVGSEMSVVLNNPDFSASFNGWTVEGTGEMAHGGVTDVMHVVRGMDGPFTVKQALTELPNGIYELQLNGFTRTANDVASKLYTSCIFMNDVVTPIMAISEDPVFEEDAEDGVNCHITGSSLDVTYYDDVRDASGWVPGYMVGCSYAFNANRYLNRVAVEVTDGTLTLGVRDLASSLSNWTPFANARLFYLGSADEANDALSEVLESVVARATVIRDFVADTGSDYAKSPNMSAELTSQIAAAIEESASATTGAQKMAAIKRFSELFAKVYSCRMAYVDMLKATERLEDLATKLYRAELLGDDDYKAVLKVTNETWDAYIGGTVTEEQARERIAEIEQVYGEISLPSDEEGVYHLSQARHLLIFSSLVNEGEWTAKAVMDADIDMTGIENYIPIGNTSANASAFRGVFDGQGHTISNLTINIDQTSTSHVGFIGLLYTGTVRNLCIKNETINNYSTATVARGGIVGRDGSGRIENCCVINLTFNDQPVVESSTTAVAGVCGYMSSSATTIYLSNYAYHAVRVLEGNTTMLPSFGGKGSNATEVRNYFDSQRTTDDMFASGEITYLLNDSQSDIPVWYQTLGVDVYPVLSADSKVVYKREDGTYTNDVVAPVDPDMPVADVLDIVFKEDGTAEDASPMNNVVELCGETSSTYFNETYNRYVARFENPWGKNCTGFYKVNFEENEAVRNALADGHTLEMVVMGDYEGALEDVEAKPFSAMQGGGTGFLISKTTANGSDGKNVFTFLPNVTETSSSTWRWVTSSVVPKAKTYYHVIGVWNKEEAKASIYVNGELSKSVGAPGEYRFASTGCNWFCIGGDPSNATDANAGWTGDVVIARIYDKALSSKEAALLWKKLNEESGVGTLSEDAAPAVPFGIFRLDGVRVDKAQQGIYIIDGKKVLVK
ncbi:MAG: LamG domain-containing protein [Bacteroidaceae bacterium]|nr:LamG domain-containing protein [Bacteroidaceae bacterium]